MTPQQLLALFSHNLPFQCNNNRKMLLSTKLLPSISNLLSQCQLHRHKIGEETNLLFKIKDGNNLNSSSNHLKVGKCKASNGQILNFSKPGLNNSKIFHKAHYKTINSTCNKLYILKIKQITGKTYKINHRCSQSTKAPNLPFQQPRLSLRMQERERWNGNLMMMMSDN